MTVKKKSIITASYATLKRKEKTDNKQRIYDLELGNF